VEVTAALVTLVAPTDVAEARRRAAAIAGRLDLDDAAGGRVAIAVTELSTNLLKHAGRGEIFIGPAGAYGSQGVQVMAMDRAGGIDDLDASLADGYSTAGTPGSGLGAVRRAGDTFDVYTGSAGTVVAATIFRAGRRPLAADAAFGALSVAAPGEERCGDDWAVWTAGELSSVFVCDGLGHGVDAARAASRAIDTFYRHAERSAPDVIGAVHDALRSTRGAAVALAELDRRQRTVRYCGVGNIGAVIVRPDGRAHHLVSLPGIAGHAMRRLQPFTSEWPAGGVLVMHSDGLGTHWSLGRYDGLLRRRPDVIAGVLFRDHRRGRDDATVVVMREGREP
jgi:anti-sigma regulatory factor (Ser/Thr protein kinase)